MVKRLTTVVLMALALSACNQPPNETQKCAALSAAKEIACAKPGKPCDVAKQALAAAGCVVPTPTAVPTPTPVGTPTPTPEPTATPSPVPTPVPTPPVQTGWEVCPKQPNFGATVIINASVYGQGVDTSVYVLGDTEFCQIIHGVNTNKCHLEGWGKRQACETKLIEYYSKGRGKCPVFRYRTKKHEQACLQRDDYEDDGMSCDHFGDTSTRDDPATEDVFEGVPSYCGLQRDEFGSPMAGYFAIAHGDGEIQACLPGYDGCGRWIRVVH